MPPPCHAGVLVIAAAAQKDQNPDPASASIAAVAEDGAAIPASASVIATVAAQTEKNQNPDDAVASAVVMMGRGGAASARSSC